MESDTEHDLEGIAALRGVVGHAIGQRRRVENDSQPQICLLYLFIGKELFGRIC